jgi:hypothetical protein
MNGTPRTGLFATIYSLPFWLGAGLAVLMLATDKNLQTDFGTISSGYFVHWYAVLAIAIADVVGAVLLLWTRSRTAVKVGVVGSGLLSVALLAVIFTYSQVGFASAGAFANYLFGVTYYGGDLRYLYDALLGTELGTCAVGVVGLVLTRDARAAQSASEDRDRSPS